MPTFFRVHWLLEFNLRPRIDLLQQTFPEQCTICRCVSFAFGKVKYSRFLGEGEKRPWSEGVVTGSPLAREKPQKMIEVTVLCCLREQTKIRSPHSICKSRATSSRLGRVENWAHPNGHRTGLWGCWSLPRRERGSCRCRTVSRPSPQTFLASRSFLRSPSTFGTYSLVGSLSLPAGQLQPTHSIPPPLSTQLFLFLIANNFHQHIL